MNIVLYPVLLLALLTSEMVHMGPELSYIHKDLRNIEEPVVGQ